MHSKSCDCCLEWTASTEAVEAALKGRWRPSQSCAHHSLMWIAIEQFRKGHPAWWVVGGAVVVPIWAVEQAKKHARLVALPMATSGYAEKAAARSLH